VQLLEVELQPVESILPELPRMTSPAFSNTLRCLEIDGWLI